MNSGSNKSKIGTHYHRPSHIHNFSFVIYGNAIFFLFFIMILFFFWGALNVQGLAFSILISFIVISDDFYELGLIKSFFQKLFWKCVPYGEWWRSTTFVENLPTLLSDWCLATVLMWGQQTELSVSLDIISKSPILLKHSMLMSFESPPL